jgi:hypothetical protein
MSAVTRHFHRPPLLAFIAADEPGRQDRQVDAMAVQIDPQTFEQRG